jgi:hypothetical protein
MAKLSDDLRAHLYRFAHSLVWSTGDDYLYDGAEYSCVWEEPEVLPQAFAIWCNVLEVDEQGRVLNGEYARWRASQYVNNVANPELKVEPPFEPWELAPPPGVETDGGGRSA